VGRTNFFAIFGVFEIFDRNFPKILAPPGDRNGELSKESERAIRSEQNGEMESKSTNKQ